MYPAVLLTKHISIDISLLSSVLIIHDSLQDNVGIAPQPFEAWN
jgi:hypothetical protein